MNFIVGLLTFVTVCNALLLILLVLVQLPKKDAGAGMAFGGGTADALFGAGSGNALTKITKNATLAFILLCLFIGYLHDKVHADNSAADFLKQVQAKQMSAPAMQPAPVATPPATTATPPPAAGNLLSTLPAQTNAPAAK
jgi:protein translocase SecG subunit